MEKVYNPHFDEEMQNPYTDIKEEREREGVKYTYVHGGFKGTDIKFSLYYPENGKYKGRFFQYLPPAANHEDASQKLTGGDDKILFALTHGAYFVESNLGDPDPFGPNAKRDHTLTYRASSAVAEYSREIANEIYGNIKRPYGYIYGGSGGAYKTISCVENTHSWDGAVPYVHGAPVSVPHNLTIRAHTMRILRNKLPDIIETLKQNPEADIYSGLSEYEKTALEELFHFGFPKGAIVGLEFLKDGSLPILMNVIKSMDSTYCTDFWTKEGYAGFDKNSDAYKARLYHKTKITGKYVPAKGEAKAMDNTTGVDTNWQRYKGMSGALGTPLIKVESMPKNNFYLMGCFVYVLTGKAAGKRVNFNEFHNNTLAVSEYFGCDDMMDVMASLEVGDEVLLDNSDYVAATDYHLHALPEGGYAGYFDCYKKDGSPKYVQRDHVVNVTGVGGKMTGDFDCKMIVEGAYCDESAFPYQSAWYRDKVYKVQGKNRADKNYRLQLIDNALHDDRAEPVSVELNYVTNCQAINQCILDVAAWVEKGIEPPAQSQFTQDRGKLTFSNSADDRKGIQNVCSISVNGKKKLTVKIGEKVKFNAEIEIPEGAGELTNIEWSFEGEKDFPVKTGVVTEAEHTFNKAGTYRVVMRAYNERNGDSKTPFTQIRNITYMTVEVI